MKPLGDSHAYQTVQTCEANPLRLEASKLRSHAHATANAAPTLSIFTGTKEKNVCTIAHQQSWKNDELPNAAFCNILQREEPSLLKVPQEAGEYDRATNTRYDERPLESMRHLKHGDPLKVHAEDPGDNPEDGHHKRSGGQQQLELDQLVPDVILQ